MIESVAIIVILGFPLGFTGFLVDQQIPNRILEFLTDLSNNRLVFLASLKFEKPVTLLYRASLPYLILLLGVLLVITYVPWLSTFLF